MKEVLLAICIISGLIFLIKKKRKSGKSDSYNRDDRTYNRNTENTYKSREELNKPSGKHSKGSLFSNLFQAGYQNRATETVFDPKAVTWCAQFLKTDEVLLKKILTHTWKYYTSFLIPKRSGGFRSISAPKEPLLSIQQTLYQRVLLPIHIHPAATGFRKGGSVVENAQIHLSGNYILKIDIKDFFDSIVMRTLTRTYKQIGYPENIAKVLAQLSCLNRRIPQGAPTSPVLSNIVAYEMDKMLAALAGNAHISYSRYADDMVFSSPVEIHQDFFIQAEDIINKHRFILNKKKTQWLVPGARKIITGISVSSGEKMTIPKAKKRKLRQNIHYILTRGLKEHQQAIGSNDPAYLKRLLGNLYFWLSVEPQNMYVIKAISDLKKIK